MTEEAPEAAPDAAPVKAPAPAKAKGSAARKRSTTARKSKGLTMAKQILEVLAALKQPKGSSVQVIKKALRARGVDVDKKNRQINLAIVLLQKKGEIVQVKGSGASGTFKLVKEETRKRSKKIDSKSLARKPAVKKDRVSKPGTSKKDGKKKKTLTKMAEKSASKKSSPKRKPTPSLKRSGKVTPKKPRKPTQKKVTLRKSTTSTKTSQK